MLFITLENQGAEVGDLSKLMPQWQSIHEGTECFLNFIMLMVHVKIQLRVHRITKRLQERSVSWPNEQQHIHKK